MSALDTKESGCNGASNLELNLPPRGLVESDEQNPPKSEEEDDRRLNDADSVWQTCRFVIGIGQAAYKYGSTGSKVEHFLKLCLQKQGIEGATVVLSQSELFLSVPVDDSQGGVPSATNEAFAAQFLACAKELELDMDKTNTHGGAISIGHPLGASGSRIVAHLANEFQRTDANVHVGSACIGGGQGIAVVLSRA